MTCGIPGKSKDAALCPVEAGSEMRLQFQNYDDPSRDDWVIDKSHKGPILVYLAPLESAGKGDVWFKIFEHGYSDGKWGTDLIRGDKEGKLTITIPADIKPGDYLLRNYAKDKNNGAQYFINCAHITVSGSGTSVPKASYSRYLQDR
ncbi:glycoside hydrolase [Kickxella alabastrina]|uniref:glycoside hydrolase n=1 Tax=Kickxella alabastrina TaxID=61397 RepID=UPI002220A2E2|nr:glycoside hydrolase [Kickxella alabastrina]KAI7822454.1 glycoside hydrolase [Kickxella alabastrina]